MEKEPVTFLRTSKPKQQKVVIPYVSPPQELGVPGFIVQGKHTINIGNVMQWIETAGRPDDVSCLTQAWAILSERINKLGGRPDKNACKSIDSTRSTVNFNGADLIRWINETDKNDLQTLQKLHAAIRLRVRHAKWLKRKR